MHTSADTLKGHSSFQKLWVAITLSCYGSQFGVMAISLTAAIAFGATAFQISVLGALTVLPSLLIGLQAGVWVDSFRRRQVLLLGDGVRAVVLLSGTGLLAFDVMNFWMLCGLSLLLASFSVPYDIAMQSYLPSLVKGSASMQANSRLEISRSSAGLAGPAAAGALITLLSAPFLLLLESISFTVSFLLIRKIPDVEAVPIPHKSSMRHEILSGLRFVKQHPFLGPLGVTSMLMNFFRVMFWSFMVVYQLRVLHLSAFEIGVVNGVGSIGMVTASLMANRVLIKTGIKKALVIGVLFNSVPLLGLTVVGGHPNLAVLVALHAAHGFGWVLYHANQIGYRQMITPPEMRGRMNATLRFYEWGAAPVAGLIGGALASGLGMRPALMIAAVCGVASCIVLRWVKVEPLVSDVAVRAVPSAEQRFGLDRTEAADAEGSLVSTHS